MWKVEVLWEFIVVMLTSDVFYIGGIGYIPMAAITKTTIRLS